MRAIRIAADTQLKTSKVEVFGAIVMPDGSNAGTLELYNESDDSKTAASKVISLRSLATKSELITFHEPLLCSVGLYADIGGDNAEAIIFIK